MIKKINYKNIGEVMYEETLPNGFKIIYYPTKKSKNFYISISTLFGANVNKYKKNNKIIEVIPGTAHFLEHRIMDFTKNKKAMDLINGLGSMPNAYTMYDITNYNLFGSVDILKNIKLLLDCVFKAKILEKDVRKEVGIISEEIDMENDNLSYKIMSNIFKNAFVKDKSITTPILGTKESISRITSKYLIDIYNDFYTYDKMHMVVTGDFELEEVSEYINSYFKNTKSNKKNIKVINEKEPKEVNIPYKELREDVTKTRTSILYKIPIPKIKGISPKKFDNYCNIILKCVLGSTSIVSEKIKEKNFTKFGSYAIKTKDYYMVEIHASGDNEDEFIELINQSINNIKITLKQFQSKINSMISMLILNFEDIYEVENMVTNQIKMDGKIIKNAKKDLESLTYNELKTVIKSLDFKEKTILKIKVD